MDTLEEFENATFFGKRISDMTFQELKEALWQMAKANIVLDEHHQAALSTWADARYSRVNRGAA